MATGQTDYSKFASRNAMTIYNQTADYTSATEIAWVDMRDYEGIVIAIMATALTGVGTDVFKIVANAGSAGADTDVTIVSHAIGSAPDATGDWIHLECSAEQIGAANTATTISEGGLRYVTANVEAANASDDAAIVYIRYGARFPVRALTADVVA